MNIENMILKLIDAFPIISLGVISLMIFCFVSLITWFMTGVHYGFKPMSKSWLKEVWWMGLLMQACLSFLLAVTIGYSLHINTGILIGWFSESSITTLGASWISLLILVCLSYINIRRQRRDFKYGLPGKNRNGHHVIFGKNSESPMLIKRKHHD